MGPFDLSGHSRHTRVSVLFSCDPSMPSLMRSLNSSHVVGAVSDVHGVCGLLPSAGLVSSILLSSLFWSSASCAMFGKFKGPNPLCCVKTASSGFDGVCMLDTPPSVLTTCETDFLSYDTFDCACISYGVLLAVIPICFALGFITKALGFWVLCRILLCCSCRLALPSPCLFGCCGDARSAFSFFLLPWFVVSAAAFCYYSYK